MTSRSSRTGRNPIRSTLTFPVLRARRVVPRVPVHVDCPVRRRKRRLREHERRHARAPPPHTSARDRPRPASSPGGHRGCRGPTGGVPARRSEPSTVSRGIRQRSDRNLAPPIFRTLRLPHCRVGRGPSPIVRTPGRRCRGPCVADTQSGHAARRRGGPAAAPCSCGTVHTRVPTRAAMPADLSGTSAGCCRGAYAEMLSARTKLDALARSRGGTVLWVHRVQAIRITWPRRESGTVDKLEFFGEVESPPRHAERIEHLEGWPTRTLGTEQILWAKLDRCLRRITAKDVFDIREGSRRASEALAAAVNAWPDFGMREPAQTFRSDAATSRQGARGGAPDRRRHRYRWRARSHGGGW